MAVSLSTSCLIVCVILGLVVVQVLSYQDGSGYTDDSTSTYGNDSATNYGNDTTTIPSISCYRCNSQDNPNCGIPWGYDKLEDVPEEFKVKCYGSNSTCTTKVSNETGVQLVERDCINGTEVALNPVIVRPCQERMSDGEKCSCYGDNCNGQSSQIVTEMKVREINCYRCKSTNDTKCGITWGYATPGDVPNRHKVKCRGVNVACQKIVSTDGPKDYNVTVRDCFNANQTHLLPESFYDCMEISARGEACYCKGDNCNGQGHLLASSLLVVMTTSVALWYWN